MVFLETEEIINALNQKLKQEKGLKNKYLLQTAIKALNELKDRTQ